MNYVKPPVYIEEFVVDGREVRIDPSEFMWNEATVNEWMPKAAALYIYLGQVCEDAGSEMEDAKREHLLVYNEKFSMHKDNGCANDLAKARAEMEQAVIDKDKIFHRKKRIYTKVKQHQNALLRSMDLAENRAHTLRKEMDKMNLDMYTVSNFKNGNE